MFPNVILCETPEIRYRCYILGEKKSRDLTGRVANSPAPIARARGLYYVSHWRLAPSLLPYRIVPSLRDSFLCSQKRFFEVVR